MPQSARTGCRPRHSEFVTNPSADVYFRRATNVHNFRSGALLTEVDPKAKAQAWQAIWRCHHFSAGWKVPGTAVDSTFQVLLCWAGSDSFLPAAQTVELLSSPL
jgi:hypothetical protein